MSEIDWSKAPEGATHYLPSNSERGYQAMWYKQNGSHWYAIAADGTEPQYWMIDDYELDIFVPMLIPRPSGWSGDGLPTVGTYIQWLSDQYGWLGGRVVGHDGSVTVVSHNDGYTGCHAHEIRPIRTPEQIAAEERYKAIRAIELHILKAQEQYLSVAQTAQRIYDAGFQVPKP